MIVVFFGTKIIDISKIWNIKPPQNLGVFQMVWIPQPPSRFTTTPRLGTPGTCYPWRGPGPAPARRGAVGRSAAAACVLFGRTGAAARSLPRHTIQDQMGKPKATEINVFGLCVVFLIPTAGMTAGFWGARLNETSFGLNRTRLEPKKSEKKQQKRGGNARTHEPGVKTIYKCMVSCPSSLLMKWTLIHNDHRSHLHLCWYSKNSFEVDSFQ